MKTLVRRAQTVHQRLLAVYGEPTWRRPLPALDELVSTILSQNTTDINRDRAFDGLRARFPTWEAVRDASSRSVIAAIRPAGLANQKGPRIQTVLRQITAERGSLQIEFLRDLSPEEARAWLLRFNGVGPKTAAIVMLFSSACRRSLSIPTSTGSRVVSASFRRACRPTRPTLGSPDCSPQKPIKPPTSI